MTLKDQLEKLAKEYPLVLHTDAGRLFSTVRRMKAEKKTGIPIFLRTGFAISTKNGKAANAMTKDEWEEFYNALSERLRGDYPELYERIFSPNRTGKGILDAAELTGPRAVEIANEYARNHSSALSQRVRHWADGRTKQRARPISTFRKTSTIGRPQSMLERRGTKSRFGT